MVSPDSGFIPQPLLNPEALIHHRILPQPIAEKEVRLDLRVQGLAWGTIHLTG